jgi:hypothetical protein
MTAQRAQKITVPLIAGDSALETRNHVRNFMRRCRFNSGVSVTRAYFLGQTICALGNGYAIVQMTPREAPVDHGSRREDEGANDADNDFFGEHHNGKRVFKRDSFGPGRHSGCGFSSLFLCPGAPPGSSFVEDGRSGLDPLSPAAGLSLSLMT